MLVRGFVGDVLHAVLNRGPPAQDSWIHPQSGRNGVPERAGVARVAVHGPTQSLVDEELADLSDRQRSFNLRLDRA